MALGEFALEVRGSQESVNEVVKEFVDSILKEHNLELQIIANPVFVQIAGSPISKEPDWIRLHNTITRSSVIDVLLRSSSENEVIIVSSCNNESYSELFKLLVKGLETRFFNLNSLIRVID
jgi:hypothetical protein